MQGGMRKATAIGATAFVLAGSAALAAPGTASAETKTANCGDTVTVHKGDSVSTPLGIKTVTDLLGGVLDALCPITVKLVDTVVKPVPGVGAPVAGAVNGAVKGTTGGLSNAARSAGDALTPKSGGGQPAPGTGGNQPAPGQGGGKPAPGTGGNSGNNGSAPSVPDYQLPAPNSPVFGGASPIGVAGLPASFSGGYSPMSAYSSLPAASAGLYAPAPGVRYGGQVPGYAPEFGMLGQDQQAQQQPSGVQNVGRAEALPGSSGLGGGIGLPVLMAVLALSGVSAALVRTWVLRKATATA